MAAPKIQNINLHVKDRISQEDAQRQERTATEILNRLKNQPGVILADEVGMGKTFVALTVGAETYLNDPRRRPVVVMVPSSLIGKWPRDFETFLKQCVPPSLQSQLTCRTAARSVEFLKLIDDPDERRPAFIFLTHGAMSRGLQDSWTKLAIIHQALKGRHDTTQLKRALCRNLGTLLRFPRLHDEDLCHNLLGTSPKDWLKVLKRYPLATPDPKENDDPVPLPVIEALGSLDTNALFEIIQKFPIRGSQYLKERIAEVREALSPEMKKVWETCIRQLKLDLPLLILDEAHHLKNPKTGMASLFQTKESKDDADQFTHGPLESVFERMLFLTATPFQLGHHELCSVLDRFQAIDWESPRKPSTSKNQYTQDIEALHRNLDRTQTAAVRLERHWGELKQEDLTVDGHLMEDSGEWWLHIQNTENEISQASQRVLNDYSTVKEHVESTQILLKPWVIRHARERKILGGATRRKRLPGKSIHSNEPNDSEGIGLTGDFIIPFLLASRAVACSPESRPVFSEGLSSSFEAFLHTRIVNREKNESSYDEDEENESIAESNTRMDWYLQEIESCLKTNIESDTITHPKLSATVKRAVALWRKGEKVLIFCHFVATGKTLRQEISNAIAEEVRTLAAQKLACSKEEADRRLELLEQRFESTKSPIRKACNSEVERMIADFPTLQPHLAEIQRIVRRNIRTAPYLARFFPIHHEKFNADSLKEALNTKDGSGMTLRGILTNFFHFLGNRCEENEREHYIKACLSVKSSTMGADVKKTYGEDEIKGDHSENILASVKLANGSTPSATRQTIMLTFNTPFYPDILIASAVMAEGVDLHLNCRHIIHHDLCWNPSTLEQRTGRVDRIGAKVEKCHQPIHVYLPFIAETQDEKMYRVVMDREKWFNVVMGEKVSIDAKSTEAQANRIEFPDEAAKALIFDLRINK